MDRIVKEAMAKWPNVPACTGWLALDRRGQFRMRDEACQAANAPGEPIRHAALNAFIARNYMADAAGRWFFQNGPQRVFVDLDYTPLVVRLHEDTAAAECGVVTEGIVLVDQCGLPFTPSACWADDAGNLLFSGRRSQPVGVSALSAADDVDAANSDDAEDAETIALLNDHDLGLFLSLFPDTAAQLAEWMGGADHDQSAGRDIGLPWPGAPAPLPCAVIDAADVDARFGFTRRPTV